MRARDVMIPIQSALVPGDGIEEFISRIREVRSREKTHGVRTLPVVNSSGRLAGIVSMFDILAAMHPAYLYGANVHMFTWDGMLESLADKVKGKKVSDLMTVPVVVVHDDHPLMECVDQMIKYRISAIPVVDMRDMLIGMLYESDIFFAVSKYLMGGR